MFILLCLSMKCVGPFSCLRKRPNCRH